MQLFHTPDINPPLYTLPEEESRHAVRVLRLGAGSRLHLTDGRGTLYEAEVVDPSPRGCVVRVVEAFPEYGRRPYSLTMAVAPTKNSDRYEWFLEKATEIGVDAVVPVECANSERVVFKPERAMRLMVSAMKQSLKTYMPRLEPLTPVRSLIARPFDGVKLIAHCRAEDFGAACAAGVVGVVGAPSPSGTPVPPVSIPPRVPITAALPAGSDVLVLIGPEGDFTVEEVALAVENGFLPVSLGESRLRTETAALAAVVAAYLVNMQ